MDSFDVAFETIKIPVTSIPMILQAGYSVKKGKKPFSRLVDIINKFLNEYDDNEEYRKFVQSGASASENVSG